MTPVFCHDVRKVHAGTPDCCASCHSEWDDVETQPHFLKGDRERGFEGYVCCAINDVVLTDEEWERIRAADQAEGKEGG